MKRGAPIKRKTPLKTGRPPKRTEWKRKPTKAQTGWAKAVATVKKRSGGRCEVGTPACAGAVGEGRRMHHRLRRSQGGKADPSLLADCCLSCDEYLMSHVAEAYANGWLVHRWDAAAASS
jgi:hypothetical protein